MVAPPPEPTPPRAELAHEVPDIVAKMEADPAYVGIWEADRREDLDVFLTGVSALLAEGAISKRVVTELKTRGLNPLVEAVGRVVLRAGKLPDPIVAKFAAHLDATAAEDNAGLWLPTSADTVRDYTVVATYAKPEDASVLRQLLAARSAGSWVRWHDGDTPPKRPWLATEIGALERLQQLDELTAVEQARLASLTAPDDALVVANDLGVGAKGADLIEKIATRYGVSARDVADKAAKAAELCDGGIGHVSGALVFAEGTSRTKEQREVVPLDDAFVLYVAQGCPT